MHAHGNNATSYVPVLCNAERTLLGMDVCPELVLILARLLRNGLVILDLASPALPRPSSILSPARTVLPVIPWIYLEVVVVRVLDAHTMQRRNLAWPSCWGGKTKEPACQARPGQAKEPQTSPRHPGPSSSCPPSGPSPDHAPYSVRWVASGVEARTPAAHDSTLEYNSTASAIAPGVVGR